eukprot:scaffold25500_cov31-Attheya_sp.AAC.3
MMLNGTNLTFYSIEAFAWTDGGGAGCGRLWVCVADDDTPSNDGEQAPHILLVAGDEDGVPTRCQFLDGFGSCFTCPPQPPLTKRLSTWLFDAERIWTVSRLSGYINGPSRLNE